MGAPVGQSAGTISEDLTRISRTAPRADADCPVAGTVPKPPRAQGAFGNGRSGRSEWHPERPFQLVQRLAIAAIR